MSTEPNLLLAAGDLHGDPVHTLYVMRRAVAADVDAIVVVGDYGYWEHRHDGVPFLDLCSQLAIENDIPFYWVDGNHENHTLLRARYGPGGEQHTPTVEGFWEIREGLYYIPRGCRWTWNGVRLMGLGGAYSTDKPARLDYIAQRQRKWARKNYYRRQANSAEKPFPDRYQVWWPEEELTDDEVNYALRSAEPVDVLFTHDKPRGSNPRWNRKDLPECWPNQDRIQQVVNRLHPKLLVHGHLHYRYTDEIRCGDDGKFTRVEGLNCNIAAQDSQYRRAAAESCLLVQLRPDSA